MNHGFFNTTQKLGANPCTGRASVHQGKKKKAQQGKSIFKGMMIFFLDIGEIGCLKVRPLTRSTTRKFWQTFVNGWEEEDLKCGRTAHGFFTKTTRRHTTPCLSRRFWRRTSTVLAWRSPMWLFFYFQRTSLR